MVLRWYYGDSNRNSARPHRPFLRRRRALRLIALGASGADGPHCPLRVNETKTGTPNGLNQLTQVGAKPLSHDAKGNVTAFGTKAFAYSSENLLTGGPSSTTLSYDPVMRLHQTVSGGATVRFAYDGLDRIAEYNASNALQRRYVHGPAVDEPLVWYEGTGTTNRRFLGSDERGSIVSLTGNAGGVLGLNRYDEFGQPQGTNMGAFGYTGQAWLPTVGLWYYKARVYDSELGRFLQPDPIGYEDGPNMYAYVGNDPVNFVDPLGLQLTVTYCKTCDWQNAPYESRPWPSPSTPGGLVGPSGRDIVVIRRRRAQLNNVVRTTASLIVPGWDFANCAIGGSCSRGQWALAAFDIVPGLGKLGKIAKVCGCLEAGTLVATPDGLVPIERIKVGDLVLAVNEQTGEVAAKPVTALIRPEPKPLYRLKLTDAGGEAEAFHATDDHPWKVEGKSWVETANLKPGDRIDTGSGADMVVASLTITGRVEATYNLTVADWHTFLVGEDGAVVHNAKCGKGRPGNNKAQNRQVRDAAQKAGLTPAERARFSREVEERSRELGQDLSFDDLLEIAFWRDW